VEQHAASTRFGGGSTSTDPLKVIIADDDAFVRRLVKGALQAEGIIVIAEASNGRDAVELTLHYEPDAVLMDVVMPGVDGITATRQILTATPDQAVILLTGSVDDELGLLGLRAGAAGFLTKDQPVEALTRALRAVSRGEAAISRHLATRLVEYLRAVPERQTAMRPVLSPLTTREWEVLALIEEKRSNSEIADSLVVSMATVRSHVKSILRKLDVRSREEAVHVAARMREGQ
jgi:NarL family two-component system response regulator LiaR